jgi:hypothetical protein
VGEIRVYSEVTELSIDEVKPYWNNPRINDKTKQALVDAFAKIGFNQPIVVDQEGVIVKGHARYYAAVMSGMETIPAIISEATDAQNKEDRILDNSIQDLTVWDPDAFEAEIRKVDMELKFVFEHLEDDIKAGVEQESEVQVVCPKCGHEVHLTKTEALALEEVE